MELYSKNLNLRSVIEQAGYKDLRSLLFLHLLVKNINPEYALELGTGFACSTIFMALANDTTRIFSIDDYRGDVSQNISEPKKNLDMHGVSDRVRLIEGNTKDGKLFNKYINHESIEVVFMDASHNEEDLWLEYDNFGTERFLKKDHIIVIDDYYSVYQGVSGVSDFILKLSKNYPACFILNFHEGIAVLITNIEKYSQSVNEAIKEACHAKKN